MTRHTLIQKRSQKISRKQKGGVCGSERKTGIREIPTDEDKKRGGEKQVQGIKGTINPTGGDREEAKDAHSLASPPGLN